MSFGSFLAIMGLISVIINIGLIGMIIQVELTPASVVVWKEVECPDPIECPDTEIIIEACDPEVELDSCIAEKFQYGEQLTEVDKIINPNNYAETY